MMQLQNSSQLRTTMVDTQVRPSDVTKFPIIDALLSVPREAFVPDGKRSVAYADAAIPLGLGREMIDVRHLSRLLDALDLKRSDSVMAVGSGLGYSAAVLAHMVNLVVAVEEQESFAEEAEAALTAHEFYNAIVVCGPLGDGAPKTAPYDAILVEGAVEVVPTSFGEQLRDGGRIVAVFSEGGVREARLGVKRGDDITWRPLFSADIAVLPGFSKVAEFSL